METSVKGWIAELTAAEKYFRKWQDRADSVMRRYLDEREAQTSAHRFNVLWSNVEIQNASIYGQLPKAEVERRYLDKDPVGRTASEILERALTYCMDAYDFDGVLKKCREDFLLPGRVVARVDYKPTYGDEITPDPYYFNEGDEFTDDDGNEIEPEYDDYNQPFYQADPFSPVVYEEVETSHVHRKDFLHQPAKCWTDVGWVAFRETLSKRELRKRFGELGEKVPTHADHEDDEESTVKKGEVWEIWDKTNSKVIWICKEYGESVLDEGEPPLSLSGFFPCPPCLLTVKTNDSLVPTPEYAMYQDQADELDNLTARIDLIIKGMKVVGVYSAALKEPMSRIFDQAENTLVPVEEWAMFAEKGGMRGVIDWYPVEQVAIVLDKLMVAREAAKQALYEISGISDILRGQVDPREKASQSKIKAQFGSRRLTEKQSSFSNYVRDLIRLKAEVIAEQFSPVTLSLMTGLPQTQEERPLFEQAVQLLRNDALRGFRVDIETDSTVAADEEKEKVARVEFMQATGAFLESSSAVAEKYPQIVPLLGEMLLFGIRGFRTGRTLENRFEQFVEQLSQQAAQPQQPEPDPKLEKVKVDAQKAQVDARNETLRTNAEVARTQADIQDKQAGRTLEVVSGAMDRGLL